MQIFRRLRRATTLAWGLSLALAGAGVQAIEEPAYEVERMLTPAAGGPDAPVEVRRYASYVVAEVTIEGAGEDAGSRAFPILAGYIFGKNKGDRRMAMTAPVMQSTEPMKMAMTAPVTQRPQGTAYLVQFVLPREVTLDRAPEPMDARVSVREVPAQRLAAVRFSGLSSRTNYDTHLAHLRATLTANGLRATGEPVYSRYNAPWTPWFMRRNEIWLALE